MSLLIGALEIVEGKDGAHPKLAPTAYSGAMCLKSCLDPGRRKIDRLEANYALHSKLCSLAASECRQLKVVLCFLVFVDLHFCLRSLVTEHTAKFPTFPTLLFQTAVHPSPNTGCSARKGLHFQETDYFHQSCLSSKFSEWRMPLGERRQVRVWHRTSTPPCSLNTCPSQHSEKHLPGCPRAGPGSQPVLKPHLKVLWCAPHLPLAKPSLLQGFPQGRMLLSAFLQGTLSQMRIKIPAAGYSDLTPYSCAQRRPWRRRLNHEVMVC